jgi:hypothetical protein
MEAHGGPELYKEDRGFSGLVQECDTAEIARAGEGTGNETCRKTPLMQRVQRSLGSRRPPQSHGNLLLGQKRLHQRPYI